MGRSAAAALGRGAVAARGDEEGHEGAGERDIEGCGRVMRGRQRRRCAAHSHEGFGKIPSLAR